MVNRRTFMQRAGSFATAAVVLPVLPSSQARRYKIGLQLFTVNRAMNQDAAGSIQRVAPWAMKKSKPTDWILRR